MVFQFGLRIIGPNQDFLSNDRAALRLNHALSYTGTGFDFRRKKTVVVNSHDNRHPLGHRKAPLAPRSTFGRPRVKFSRAMAWKEGRVIITNERVLLAASARLESSPEADLGIQRPSRRTEASWYGCQLALPAINGRSDRRPASRKQPVERTAHGHVPKLHHVRVDHRGGHVRMPQQLLHRAGWHEDGAHWCA